jgi:transposase InsO family protein
MNWFSLNELYRAVDVSKQAVLKEERRQIAFDAKMRVLLAEVDALREEHPGCGVEKIYDTLRPDFIGRDRFVNVLMELGYRLRKKKNYKRTTFSVRADYPNLIKGLKVDAPDVVWQSDITYVRVGERFFYAVFLIDVYTKRIVGHQVSDHMRAEANLRALRKALVGHGPPGIHHSDKGVQYTCTRYVKLLEGLEAEISMCECAQDNAYAERVHQTIKYEYLAHRKIENLRSLRKEVDRAVEQYNNRRLHDHLPKMSPNDFENWWQTLRKDERPVMTIFDEQIPSRTGQP